MELTSPPCLQKLRLKAPLSESPLLESYMLVWSTFLTAVLAATDTTRLGPGPEVTITVD
jgi:hypothetical protein